MSKHTPGPWEARYVVSGYHRIIAPNETEPTCVCDTALWKDNDAAVDMANAHLIAAAPDMLAALDTAAAAMEWTGLAKGKAYQAVLDAMSKAKGQ